MHDYLVLKYLCVKFSYLTKVRQEPPKESLIVSVHSLYAPNICTLTQLSPTFDTVFDR